MKTQTIYIPIHSFSDLITNSSSETYICAGQGTITTAKDIINSLLKLTNSQLTATDLFSFDLIYTIDINSDDKDKAKAVGIINPCEYWCEVPATKEQIERFVELLDADAREDFQLPWENESYYNVYMRVTAKDKSNQYADKVANMLSNFIDTYEFNSEYNS